MTEGVRLLTVAALPFGGAAIAFPLARATRQAGWLLALVPLAILLLLPSSGSAHLDWVPSLGLSIDLRVDALSRMFALTIAGVGLAVVPYAGAYMADDPRRLQFLATLMAFMGAMLGIVLAANPLLMFVAWELTSVTSFLLIGHDHEKAEARRAARQAFLVTFGGGLALLAGLVALDRPGLESLAMACLCVGAFTKSAQIPFHFWLPNAMAAPTPVSAYLHSATMVQAGVYLLARYQPRFASVPGFGMTLLVVGSATAVLGAVLCLRQTDLKRILAYSTVGALGLSIACIGQGAMEAFAGFFVAHALYKAAMFLVAGAVDHGTGTRDLLRLGGLRKAMPVTALAGLMAGISMAGVPPSLGFFAKEGVLAGGAWLAAVGTFYGACSFAAAVLAGWRPFFGKSSGGEEGHEAPWAMWLGPVGLAATGLALGFGRFGEFHLGLPFTLSLVSLGLGVFLAWKWPTLRALDLGRFSAEGAGRRLAAEFSRLAGWLTRKSQHGHLSGYIRRSLATLVVAVGLGWWQSRPGVQAGAFSPATLLECVIVSIMAVGAAAAILTLSRMAAIAALGIVGYGVALVYVMYGAPDLAMTQVAVETLTLLLFVFTVFYLPEGVPRRNRTGRTRDGIVAGLVGATMAGLTLIATSIQNDGVLSRYFAENAAPLGHGRNVVNVILVEFRGFDTLGEITVLSVAAVGVFALIRMRLGKGGSTSRP